MKKNKKEFYVLLKEDDIRFVDGYNVDCFSFARY